MASLVRVGPPRYVAPCSTAGLVVRGNININDRPLVHFQGGIATVRSITIGPEPVRVGGKTRRLQILIPTVIGNRVVSFSAAIAHYRSSHRHLGMFDNNKHAEAYAICLHNYQAKVFGTSR